MWDCSIKVTNTFGQGAQGTEYSTLITNISRQSAELKHTANGAQGTEIPSTSNNYYYAKCRHTTYRQQCTGYRYTAYGAQTHLCRGTKYSTWPKEQ